MRNITKRIVSLFLALMMFALPLSMAGCSEKPEYVDYEYYEMGSPVRLRIATSAGALGYLDTDYIDSVANECEKLLEDLDGVLSDDNPSSQLSSLNSEVSVLLNADKNMLSTLSAAQKLNELTHGAYDFTLGTLNDVWNVENGGPVPDYDDIKEAAKHTGVDKIVMNSSAITKNDKLTKLDFDGIKDGTAVQLLLEYLDSTNVVYAVISVGSTVGVYGQKPEFGTYKIGLPDPDQPTDVIGYVYVLSGLVSVAGDYECFFEEDGVRYHDIIDPETSAPAKSGVRSVAVITSNGASANALSKALFVLGVDKSLELYEEGTLDFEAIFVTDDGKIISTPGVSEDNFILTSDKYEISK